MRHVGFWQAGKLATLTLSSVKAESGVTCWWHFTGTECLDQVNLFGSIICLHVWHIRGIWNSYWFWKSPLTYGLISFNRWRHWSSPLFIMPDADQHLLNSATQEIPRKESWCFHEKWSKSSAVLAVIGLFSSVGGVSSLWWSVAS